MSILDRKYFIWIRKNIRSRLKLEIFSEFAVHNNFMIFHKNIVYLNKIKENALLIKSPILTE